MGAEETSTSFGPFNTSDLERTFLDLTLLVIYVK